MPNSIPLIRGFALLPTLHWLAGEGVPVERALAEVDLSLSPITHPFRLPSVRYLWRTRPLCSGTLRGNTGPTFLAESFRGRAALRSQCSERSLLARERRGKRLSGSWPR